MPKDGRQLEGLVAFVEKVLGGQGLTVKRGDKVFTDGVQEAEFDVVVEGKVGSTQMRWLIECRDRPGDGAADGQWIDSLYGRRERYGFNKVTAVSTTGFSPSAIKSAERNGIELRTVDSLTPDAFADWLPLTHLTLHSRHCELRYCQLLIGTQEPDSVREAVVEFAKGLDPKKPVLRSTKTGDLQTPVNAFLFFVQNQNLFEQVKPGTELAVDRRVNYINDDDHFVVDTRAGPVRIRAIKFGGVLRVQESPLQIAVRKEYKELSGATLISQFAATDPVIQIYGTPMALEFHHIPASGTHIALRSFAPAKQKPRRSKKRSRKGKKKRTRTAKKK